MSAPSSNGPITANHCLACGGPLPPGRPRTTCSDGCRQALWRRRHQPPPPRPLPPPPGRSKKEGTVYECPVCSERQVGEQYCSDCGTFCRRLGPGGYTPCCGEAVTVEELFEA